MLHLSNSEKDDRINKRVKITKTLENLCHTGVVTHTSTFL